MAIQYFEIETRAKLSNRRALNKFITTLIQQHLPSVKKFDLAYIFCSDDYLLTINQDFLQHDTYTDIITFDLSENVNHLQAEMYISIDRITENAAKFNTDYERELHRVIFHGVLHLCGFKDKTEKDSTTMRSQEETCMNAYFSQQIVTVK